MRGHDISESGVGAPAVASIGGSLAFPAESAIVAVDMRSGWKRSRHVAAACRR
jgi:hypothetical protein